MDKNKVEEDPQAWFSIPTAAEEETENPARSDKDVELRIKSRYVASCSFCFSEGNF